jgi:ubiquinone/menaquinone biosynthesis C-methylase UbiE
VTLGTRFARLATDLVVRRPVLWRLLRRPLQHMFDRLAPTWDQRRSPTRLAGIEAALAAIATPPSRVLDLGTGTGDAAFAMARRWPATQVIGVDLAEQMVAEARRKTAAELAARVRFQTADAAALPFEDGAFDLVALANAIPFFDELARVVAPGGHVAFGFSAGPQTPIYVPPERLRAELARRGFTDFRDVAAGPATGLLARMSDRD